RRERRVEHPERVRISDLAKQRDAGVAAGPALAAAGRERRPLADAVSGQDGGMLRRRREEDRRGVRVMVVGEKDLVAADAEVRRDDAARPDLLAERVLDGFRKRSPGMRKRSERRRENAV